MPLEGALKEHSMFPWAAQELLKQEPDHARSDARSKQIVERKGKSYWRHWVPTERGEGGMVSRSQGYWVELSSSEL
jgi:hypothetical protein